MSRGSPLPPTLAFALLVCVAAAVPLPRPQAPDVAVLHKYVRGSDAELRRVAHGEVMTRTLDSPDGKEVTSFGVIRVRCTADVFAARVRDIERFKASEYVLQIGRFQKVPSLPDVAALVLDPGDREAMKSCRPGSCGLRLPAAAMERFRTAIPWGTPGEVRAAATEMQQFLVDEARTYLASGSGALADYRDRSGTTPRADAFRFLLRPAVFLSEYDAELFRWLDQFPHGQLAGVDSFLYWSREKFGLKPTISISHSALLRREGSVAFVSKQVFASHYFESSLGMAQFVVDPGTPDAYVTYLNRSRVDTLRGFLAPLARVIAARRARDGLEKMLIDVKRKLEAPAAPAPGR